MPQIAISDESYQILMRLTQDRQLTPEQVIGLALEHLEIEQERAEYGDAFIEELRQQANAPRSPDIVIYASTEEFLQAVRDAPYASLEGTKDDDL